MSDRTNSPLSSFASPSVLPTGQSTAREKGRSTKRVIPNPGQLLLGHKGTRYVHVMHARECLFSFYRWKRCGWGTWIRTKINGVRVRRSTVELFPNAIRSCLSAPLVRHINDLLGDASRKMRGERHFLGVLSCLPSDAGIWRQD